MSLQLHCIVEHSAHFHDRLLMHPVKDQVAGTRDACALAAVSEMVASHVWTQLRSRDRADPEGVGRKVAQCGGKQMLVTRPRTLAVALFGPRQEVGYVRLRYSRQSESGHRYRAARRL
jgi:hypothetical protein